MKVSELIQAMSAAGAPMEAILIAVQALEAKEAEIAARDAEVSARRAKDAERKRMERARVRGQSVDGPETVQADPALSPSPNEINSNPHPHTHPDGDTPRTRKADPWPRPDWANPQHWADLKANRRAKRLPNTPTAFTKFLRDLAKWVDEDWPPGRVLEAIAARGWASAEHDPRDTRKTTNDRPKPASNDEIQNPYARVAARRQADRVSAEWG